MAIKWIKTPHKGLRYYEHAIRKHGKRKDRYYAIRFKVDGRDYGYGVGWWSDGVPEEIRKADPHKSFEEYAIAQLKLFKTNIKEGSGPKSPREKRKQAEVIKAKEQADQERLEQDAITFEDFFTNSYLPQAKADKKNGSSKREEGFLTNWFSPVIGHLPLKEVSPFHLEKLKRIMADGGQSPRSIEYALAVIRQAFNMARRMGRYGGEPPTANVKKPKVDNERMRFLTRSEARSLLEALARKSTDVHDMTLLSLHAGLRFGEIASLTWQDVDLEKGILTIRDAKAGSRYAFLTEQAATMLEGRPLGKPSDFVFQKKGAKKTNLTKKGSIKLDKISHTFFRAVDDLKLNEGIDDPRLHVCFHTCRHTYASWLIEHGQDLYTVQKLLGHKTNKMTQRYAHLSENKLKDAAAALGQALQAGENESWKQSGQISDDEKQIMDNP